MSQYLIRHENKASVVVVKCTCPWPTSNAYTKLKQNSAEFALPNLYVIDGANFQAFLHEKQSLIFHAWNQASSWLIKFCGGIQKLQMWQNALTNSDQILPIVTNCDKFDKHILLQLLWENFKFVTCFETNCD